MYDMQQKISSPASNLIQELDLFARYQEEIKSHEKRQSRFAFSWVNMATQSLPVARLFEVIRMNPYLVPPRTGHIGNWNDIIDGYIGHRNDNTVICKEQKLGYPLLFDLTQTEDELLTKGDLTYLPGSIVEQGKRSMLPLYTWDGTKFSEQTRENSFFVPFALTPREGKLLPLTQIHQERYRKYSDINFRMISGVVFQKRELLKEILNVLIEEIRTGKDPEHELNFIVDRIVSLNGQIFRGMINIVDNGYRVGQTWYKDTASFVNAILLPYTAAAEPELFFPSIQTIPNDLPLLSNHFTAILTAILYTHYPECEAGPSGLTPPCNAHVQWGGIVMAGYPPKNSGYFSRQARYVRNIHKQIVRHFQTIDPLLFILLPSSIFLLWPSDTHREDVELIEQLIEMAHQETDTLLGSPEELFAEIERQVRLWISQVKQALSPSFLNRFAGKPQALAINEVPVKSRSIEPKGFSTLTLQQASMLVGALFDCFSSE